MRNSKRSLRRDEGRDREVWGRMKRMRKKGKERERKGEGRSGRGGEELRNAAAAREANALTH